MQDLIKKAAILVEAFPYIKEFRNKVVVIKYGGRALLNKEAKHNILEDIAFMSIVGIKPVVIHGGGYRITEKIAKSGGTSKFIEGRRITNKKTIRVISEVFEELNQELVQELDALHVKAVGINPREKYLIQASRIQKKLGYVGQVEKINSGEILKYLKRGVIPVLMPLGLDAKSTIYNINADDMASEVAVSLKAEKLVLLTDVKGILRVREEEESLISTLKISDIDKLIKIGVISGGMVPKVRACVKALENGVRKTHILDGRIPHVILLEVFTTEGVGTEIIK